MTCSELPILLEFTYSWYVQYMHSSLARLEVEILIILECDWLEKRWFSVQP
jgi:hypothetical protein